MKITLIIGPMFSQKSSTMYKELNHYAGLDKKVCLLRPSLDSRGDGYTHSQGSSVNLLHRDIEVIRIKSLLDYVPVKHEIIGVEEAQFIEDMSSVVEWEGQGCCPSKVYINGLDTDYMQRPFENVSCLFPLANKIIKCNAICSGLDNESSCQAQSSGERTAVYTRRCVQDSHRVLIGGSDIYRPICRHCLRRSKTLA